MSFRGGRGGRGFGRGRMYVENKPLVYFPPEVELPEVKSVANEELHLIANGVRLQRFWTSSPYNLTEEGPKDEEERFSGKKKQMDVHKRKLSDYIKCGIEYVPAELSQGTSQSRQFIQKKVRWTQGSESKAIDLLEKLEQMHKAKGEEEDAEEEEEEVEEEEEFSDDDYNQNIDFDDDEDDYNMEPDGNDDEAIF